MLGIPGNISKPGARREIGERAMRQATRRSPRRLESVRGDKAVHGRNARRENADMQPPHAPRCYRGNTMSRITTSLPEGLASELDAMATRLERSRADIVRHAIERYLDDLDDLEAAAERLRDPNDPRLDWDRASRDLLDMD